VFAEHGALFDLGCESVLNTPILSRGQVIGSINILDIENHYTEAPIRKIPEPCARLARSQAINAALAIVAMSWRRLMVMTFPVIMAWVSFQLAKWFFMTAPAFMIRGM
jgi:hypothetical protein